MPSFVNRAMRRAAAAGCWSMAIAAALGWLPACLLLPLRPGAQLASYLVARGEDWMPLPPKQREKKKKVVAVSASKANDPLAGKRKTTKAEFAAIQAENSKAEREKKAAARAKLEEKAKAAEVARIKALTAQATQVEELTSQDGPKVISNCVARTLGLPPNQLPKQVLEQAVQLMPDVDLLPGLPKAQLLQLAAVLVERRAVKRAADFETLQQVRKVLRNVGVAAWKGAGLRGRVWGGCW
jgi:hypothetical protein